MIDRNKLIIGGIGVALLFFIFFFILLSAFFPGEKTDDTGIEPTQAINVVIPTSSTVDESTNDTTSSPTELVLISVNPPDGVTAQSPITQVEMLFNQPINEKTFYYKVEPETETFIHTEGNKIIITPKTVWNDGKVTITVFQEVQSLSGASLSTPFSYSFSVEDLPFPDQDIE